MSKKIWDGLFVGCILFVLTAGLLRTLFLPKEMNYYENRYANQVSPLTVSDYLDGTYQEQMENALSDQIYFAETCKKIYNSSASQALWRVFEPVLANSRLQYANFLGCHLFGTENIVYYPYTLSELTDSLDERINNYNETFAAHPETDFYVYYVEKDTDLNLESGRKMLIYEYLRDNLNLPDNRMARLEISSFQEFAELFYKTDHHWNLDGSYRGYGEVLSLLGITEPLIEPEERVEIGSFSGSKASESGIGFSEQFSAYRFDFPPMSITINGSPASDYGKQTVYLDGDGENVSYSNFYGGDDGEIIFDTGCTERENLLIIGESFDNAILKLIASHFNRTYSIDLRYYQTAMGTEFLLSSYLEEHPAAKVLLIGNVDYFTAPDFLLED